MNDEDLILFDESSLSFGAAVKRNEKLKLSNRQSSKLKFSHLDNAILSPKSKYSYPQNQKAISNEIPKNDKFSKYFQIIN